MQDPTAALAVHAGAVAQLSCASVKKHFDAYLDVPWDDEAFRIDPEDPRLVCGETEPLGGNAWYRAQPIARQARIGLELTAYRMKMGIEFENILSRGLLEFATSCPNGSPDFRYAYHELIEEGQHSLMFQEFVNRSGCDSPGLSGPLRLLSRTVPRLGRAFPELFFVHVLAGEVPIDRAQRRELRRGAAWHPLARRISQIHVTEEARHVRFAESYLEAHVPRLSRLRLAQLRVMAPFVTAVVTDLMLRPPVRLLIRHGVPRHVIADAYGGAAFAALRRDSVLPLCRLYDEAGIAPRHMVPAWKALGLWPVADATHDPGNALSSGTPPLLPE